jgi:hypothetical protein
MRCYSNRAALRTGGTARYATGAVGVRATQVTGLNDREYGGGVVLQRPHIDAAGAVR